MTDSETNEAVARKLGWRIKTGTLVREYTEGAGGGSAVMPAMKGWLSPTSKRKDLVVSNVPDYCHSIAAAWEVVEHIRKNQMMVSMNLLSSCQLKITHGEISNVLAESWADTAPTAICLAFLKLSA